MNALGLIHEPTYVAECTRNSWSFTNIHTIPPYKLLIPNLSEPIEILAPALSNIQQFTSLLEISLLSWNLNQYFIFNRCSHKLGNILFPPRSPSSLTTHPNLTIKKPLNSFFHFCTRMVYPITEICHVM